MSKNEMITRIVIAVKRIVTFGFWAIWLTTIPFYFSWAQEIEIQSLTLHLIVYLVGPVCWALIATFAVYIYDKFIR